MSIEHRDNLNYSVDWLQHIDKVSPKSVITGMKHIALLLDVESHGKHGVCLYRPEKGTKLELDTRVPVPSEIYRDVAYHNIDAFLGWGVSAPVIPWQLKEEDKGVLRPYWIDAEAVDVYHTCRDFFNEQYDFWIKVAVLDYICGVVDRAPNDLLDIDTNKFVVIDSGLSFVEGLDFPYQLSIVRDAMKNAPIPDFLLNKLAHLPIEKVIKKNDGLIGESEVCWMYQRINQIISQKVIL